MHYPAASTQPEKIITLARADDLNKTCSLEPISDQHDNVHLCDTVFLYKKLPHIRTVVKGVCIKLQITSGYKSERLR